MNSVLDQKDPQQLGKELQNARKQAGLTQEAAAEIINVARTTVVALEKGERRVKPGELLKLARAYKRQVSDFVRERPKIGSFEVQFRGPTAASQEDGDAISPAIQLFQELARNYIELEHLLDMPLPTKYPNEYFVGQMKVDQASDWIASEERKRLGLGDGPIPVLRNLLEQEVGLRIFFIPMDGKFSAMYIYTEETGGCIAVNSKHPEERRRFSLAHDYFHFLAHRYQSEVSSQDFYQKKPKGEQLADAFPRSFFMPEQNVIRKFHDTKEIYGRISANELCILANYYGVSVEAMTLRMEELSLLPVGTWDRVKKGKYTIHELQERLGIKPIPMASQMLPIRYQLLAVTAYDEGKITEGQMASFLQVDPSEARSIATVLRAGMPDLTSEVVA